MEQNIYRQLQKKLDQFSIGFPETESGIEIEILKRLFSEDDARVFMNVSFMLEDTQKIADKIGAEVDEADEMLSEMARRGLLFRMHKSGKTFYAAIPFVHGIWEFQIHRMDKEFAKMVKQLFEEKMNVNLAENVRDFLRVIPVNEAVDATLNIASYEDASQILKSKEQIVVAECACRKRAIVDDEGCDKPLEACFMFGTMAQYYIDQGLGRKVGLDEALKIVKQCQDAGLITQPASSLNPAGMCNCCGCCCGVFKSLALHPKPAELVFSNYYAQINQDECNGCERCLDRCQIEAITINDDDLAEINLDRCIGCGLCVTTCPTEAISLKPKNEKKMVPVFNGEAQMTNMGINRKTTGKFLKYEAQIAYRRRNIFGVFGLIANIIYRTVRQFFRSHS